MASITASGTRRPTRTWPRHYNAEAIAPGKPQCKAALQQRCGLAGRAAAPLLGVVARLVEQKGIDLIVQAAPPLLDDGAQLVVLGEGDPAYHQMLQELRKRYPQPRRPDVSASTRRWPTRSRPGPTCS